MLSSGILIIAAVDVMNLRFPFELHFSLAISICFGEISIPIHLIIVSDRIFKYFPVQHPTSRTVLSFVALIRNSATLFSESSASENVS
jgi:hypothetical protein